MDDLVVTISSGKIRGKICTSPSIPSTKFYSFQGIPYAKPPVGGLRFKAPQPPDSWTEILDASKEGNESIQRNPVLRTLQGHEDCLTLNVYTPELSDNNKVQNKRAVMVWIHGGGFVSGSGGSHIYGPEFLMTEDIVLVTLNYRLGIFGFLNFENPALGVPGNAGLKDMVMALQWVQKNITQFSGNPDNVTIFGESAGGAAAHYLVLSPKAKGLFHRAILQSGCALNFWARGKSCSTELAQLLNLETVDEAKILEILENVSSEEVFEIAGKIPDTFIASAVRPYVPVVEKNSPDAFISENPLDIIKSGNYNHVPIMIGYTNREGMLLEAFQKPRPFKPLTDFELAVPSFMNLQRDSHISKQIAQQIKEFYYKNEEPSSNNKDAFYLLSSDNFFIRELLLTARLHQQTSTMPIFLYRMSVETELNMVKKIFAISEAGVCHGDDLGYLFNNVFTPNIEQDSSEEIAIKRFVKFWTNFAKYGDPNCKKASTIINVQWKPITHQELNFLDIQKELVTDVNPEADRMIFWNKVLKSNPVHKL